MSQADDAANSSTIQMERPAGTLFELPASSPAQPSLYSEPRISTADELSETAGQSLQRLHHSIDPSEASTQIFGSSPAGTASTRQILSSPLSSRHLASGGSSNDTFAAWNNVEVFEPRERIVVVLGVETLTDPFIQSVPELDAETPTRDQQKEGDAEDAVIVDNQNSSTPARWSEDFDKFSSDGQRRRLVRVASQQYELRDRGYHLNPPPMITHWNTRSRRVAISIPSESDDLEIVVQLPQPAAEEQHNFAQPLIPPQEIRPLVPIEIAVSNARSTLDDLYDQLETLAVESRTHSWNAGVFLGRLADRDRELAEARWNVAIRDTEIRRLCDLVVERSEQIERLQRPGSAQPEPAEISSVEDYESALFEVGDGPIAVNMPQEVNLSGDVNDEEKSYSEDEGVEEGEEGEEGEQDEHEVLLSGVVYTGRFRLDLLETASDSAVNDLQETPPIRQAVLPHSN